MKNIIVRTDFIKELSPGVSFVRIKAYAPTGMFMPNLFIHDVEFNSGIGTSDICDIVAQGTAVLLKSVELAVVEKFGHIPGDDHESWLWICEPGKELPFTI